MWKNVIGQERVKKIIGQALESRKFPNAYLFTGAEGTGKDAMAIELAKALNCLRVDSRLSIVDGLGLEPEPRLEACDRCENCLAIGSLTSPLLHFVIALSKDSEKASSKDDDEDEDGVAKIDIIREQFEMKARDPYHNIQIPKALAINIKQIRDLRLVLSRSMTGGNKRVVIISEADTMRREAQNAFLKSLEEPHDNTLIILTSSNPGRLYATILSRCQDVRFDLLTPNEIADALVERDELERPQAEFLARLAGGSFSAARSLVSEDIATLRNQVVQLLLMGLSRSRKNALAEIDNFLPRAGGGSFLEKRQTVEQLLHLLTLWLRDALALSTVGATGRSSNLETTKTSQDEQPLAPTRDSADEYLFNIDQLDYLKRFTAKFGNPRNIANALRTVEIAQRNVRLQLQLRPVVLQMVMDLEVALIPR
ncbi:MAG: ATP-binding protein [Candidatus Kapaibacterium sp.]